MYLSIITSTNIIMIFYLIKRVLTITSCSSENQVIQLFENTCIQFIVPISPK